MLRTSSGGGGGTTRRARANSSSEKTGAVSASASIWASMSASLVAATRVQSTFERSRSARVRRVIGISFLPLGGTQADDPACLVAICVDADEHNPIHLAEDLNSEFAIVVTSIGLFERRGVEEGHRDLERKSTLPGIAGALGLIPFEVHGMRLVR